MKTRWSLLLLVLCLGVPAGAAEKKLTFLVTGDNGGEIAPCG